MVGWRMSAIDEFGGFDAHVFQFPAAPLTDGVQHLPSVSHLLSCRNINISNICRRLLEAAASLASLPTDPTPEAVSIDGSNPITRTPCNIRRFRLG